MADIIDTIGRVIGGPLAIPGVLGGGSTPPAPQPSRSTIPIGGIGGQIGDTVPDLSNVGLGRAVPPPDGPTRTAPSEPLKVAPAPAPPPFASLGRVPTSPDLNQMARVTPGDTFIPPRTSMDNVGALPEKIGTTPATPATPAPPTPAPPTPTPDTPATPTPTPPAPATPAPATPAPATPAPATPAPPSSSTPTPTPDTPATPPPAPATRTQPVSPPTSPAPAPLPPISVLQSPVGTTADPTPSTVSVSGDRTVAQQVAAVQSVLATERQVSTGPNAMFAAPSTAAAISVNDNYQVVDTAGAFAYHTAGAAFQGSIAGITTEYINITPGTLHVTALTPNGFIKTGAGDDILQGFSGRMVLDGGTGNNTFAGGTGQNTFVAEITPASSVIEAVGNMHRGDDIILRGLDPSVVSITLRDTSTNLGSSLLISANNLSGNGPDATVILGGYSAGDLASGRLSISFSTDSTNAHYMLVHANT